MQRRGSLTAAVVVITYLRPEHLRTCLEHLAAQTRPPDETVVVDSSPDARTRAVVAEFPSVRYLRNDTGPGTMATSRAIGLAATTSEVLVFVDDDAYADPDWLEHLLLPYANPSVAAVGGRQRRGIPGEEQAGLDDIGRLRADATLTGHFTADPGHDVDVDHLLGANMSVRRDVIQALGGIRDYYPGTCLREESDMFLRLRKAGHRVVYTPNAVVTHVAAPYARGARFDLRYQYYGQRNHIVLLARVFGLASPQLRRYAASAAGRELGGNVRVGVAALSQRPTVRAKVRGLGGGLARGAVCGAGLVAGAVAAARLRLREGPVD